MREEMDLAQDIDSFGGPACSASLWRLLRVCVTIAHSPVASVGSTGKDMVLALGTHRCGDTLAAVMNSVIIWREVVTCTAGAG